MTINSIANLVTAVTKTDGNFGQLVDLVERCGDLLLRNASALDTMLDNLEIPKFTVIHAAVLRVKLMSQYPQDRDILINQVRIFFERCNADHARKIAVHTRFISHEFTDRMITWELSTRAISIILVAIRRIQLSTDHLTALHSDLCRLSLAAKLFSPVLPILDHDVLEVDRSNSAIDTRDYLLYFYYGGLIYGSLKNWSRALHYFELCLIIPSFTLSSIVVEASKKVVLLSLIVHGKFSSTVDVQIPHLMSPKPWKRHCRPYITLASLFQHYPMAVPAFVEGNRELFNVEHNFGLVKQVLKSLVKFQILNLTKTFMTMSLMDVASRVKLSSAEEVEAYLVEMIEAKAIFARIDQQNGTVHFLDDPEQYSSLQMLLKLHEKTDACMRLEKHLMRISDQLIQTPCHVRRMLELEKLTKLAKNEQY